MSSGLLKSMKLKLAGASSKTSKAAPVGQTVQQGLAASAAPSQPSRSVGSATTVGHSFSGEDGKLDAVQPAGDQKPEFPPLTHEEMVRRFAVPLPNFRDVSPGERQALFVQKLHLCAFGFDFSDPSSCVREKDMKRDTLLELVEYVNSGSGKFRDQVAPDVLFMLRSNLFRSLPPPRERAGGDSGEGGGEEEEPLLEPAWPHLQIVHEFLLRYVVSADTDARLAKKYVDQAFVVRLLELFDSEDPRERDYLKTIVHRVYGKFMMHRPFIRKAINHIFYRFVYETERHNGIAELLEILGSIINGFALPLKEEHKLFLMRALLPLHKPRCLPAYHQQLSYCVTQFVEKDDTLAEPVLRGLLRFWPITNSHKEVLFLGELEEILEFTPPDAFARVLDSLFRRVNRCLLSEHFQVAERALFLWNNEAIVGHVAARRAEVLPIVLGALERNAAGHWNPAVHSLSVNVRRMFQEMDEGLYERCLAAHARAAQADVDARRLRGAQWAAIEAAAAARERGGGAAGEAGPASPSGAEEGRAGAPGSAGPAPSRGAAAAASRPAKADAARDAGGGALPEGGGGGGRSGRTARAYGTSGPGLPPEPPHQAAAALGV